MKSECENQSGASLPPRTCSPFFVFDVESIGLHGEGFAVAGGVYIAGAAQWEFCFCCPMDKAEGLQADRAWVSRNVPVMEETHRDTYGLRLAFWQAWEKAKDGGAEMAAECLWPVEARFLQDCIRDDAQRLPAAPYPCHEIASVMLSAGMNPMATYDRTPSELPRHNPLADARQSARLLSEALARMGKTKLSDRRDRRRRAERNAMNDPKTLSAEQSGGSAGARGSAIPRLDQIALEHGCMMPAEPHEHTPTLSEFETCLEVLRWMRDGDSGIHGSWTIPLTHICGAVRACIETLKSN